MALFGNPFPFRSSWWADPIPDIDIDFWPLADYDVFNPFGLSRSALRPQRALRQREQEKAVTQEVVSDKDKFQVTLNMPSFKPNEISVKVIDNSLDVDAEHEEKKDEYGYGHVYRHIHRRFRLPRNADLDKFSSTFSDNGTLTICAPKKPLESKKEKTIEVKPVASVQDQPKEMEVDTDGDEKEKSKGIEIPVSHAGAAVKK